MIPIAHHQTLELKACTVKLEKLSALGIPLNQYRDWYFETIKETQAEIKRLNMILSIRGAPFTALKYKPLHKNFQQ